MKDWSQGFADEAALLDQMTEPTTAVKEAVAALEGDVMILGVGGKMGPSLAELLVRAGAGRVIGVSRFSDQSQRAYLDRVGVETVAADLMEAETLARLPDVPHLFFLAGFKFGATGNESATWAMNTWLPGEVVRRFKEAKIVYVSSGNVYEYTPVESRGATETGALDPIGEYAQSRLGGERLADYWARRLGVELCTVRLFYATELRYGILHDLAWKINNGEPIDLSMGYVNQIWQGDANSYLARFFSLCSTSPETINLTGPQVLSVRALAQSLAQSMGKPAHFVNSESPTALLGDATRQVDEFGAPDVSVEQMIDWVAAWVKRGGKSWGKPTKYESRTGKF